MGKKYLGSAPLLPADIVNKEYVDAQISDIPDVPVSLNDLSDVNASPSSGDTLIWNSDSGVWMAGVGGASLPVGSDGDILMTDSSIEGGLLWTPGRKQLLNDVTFTIGTGGDYTTINAALEDIVATYYPIYLSGGNIPRVIINLKSGFIMNEQVLVRGLDLGWIWITGTDAETTITRSALTIDDYSGNSYPSAFAAGYNATLPVIDQMFTMDTTGSAANQCGCSLSYNSRVTITSNGGFKNSTHLDIYVYSGSVASVNGETIPDVRRINEIIKTTSGFLSVDDVMGTIINNYGQTSDVSLTLPVAEKGLSFMVVLGTNVENYFRIQANTNDKIYLDGVPGGDNQYVGIASAIAGATISFATFQTGPDTYDWLAMANVGEWEAQT